MHSTIISVCYNMYSTVIYVYYIYTYVFLKSVLNEDCTLSGG